MITPRFHTMLKLRRGYKTSCPRNRGVGRISELFRKARIDDRGWLYEVWLDVCLFSWLLVALGVIFLEFLTHTQLLWIYSRCDKSEPPVFGPSLCFNEDLGVGVPHG